MVIERVGTDTKWATTHGDADSGPAPRMGVEICQVIRELLME